MPQHPASGQDANPPLLRLQTNNNRSQTSQNNVLWLMQGRMAIRPATAARLRSLSQKSQNPQKQIINLFNQINLSEPQNSPFCAICERGVTTTAFILGRIAIPPYRSMSNAIGDGKPCLTAGKPQSGVACGKKATINMCLEVAQHRSTSSTPIYCVGCLLRRFRCATPAVKHSEAPSALSSQYI